MHALGSTPGFSTMLSFLTGLPHLPWPFSSMVSILVPKPSLPPCGSWPLSECFLLSYQKAGCAGVWNRHASVGPLGLLEEAEFRRVESLLGSLPSPGFRKRSALGNFVLAYTRAEANVFLFPSRCQCYLRQRVHLAQLSVLWNWLAHSPASLSKRSGPWNLGALRTYLMY